MKESKGKKKDKDREFTPDSPFPNAIEERAKRNKQLKRQRISFRLSHSQLLNSHSQILDQPLSLLQSEQLSGRKHAYG
jgi:hypothetical protein